MVSYEEPATTIREQLAATLEREEDWAKAAQVLAGIDLDSGARRRPVQAPVGGISKMATGHSGGFALSSKLTARHA